MKLNRFRPAFALFLAFSSLPIDLKGLGAATFSDFLGFVARRAQGLLVFYPLRPMGFSAALLLELDNGSPTSVLRSADGLLAYRDFIYKI